MYTSILGTVLTWIRGFFKNHEIRSKIYKSNLSVHCRVVFSGCYFKAVIAYILALLKSYFTATALVATGAPPTPPSTVRTMIWRTLLKRVMPLRGMMTSTKSKTPQLCPAATSSGLCCLSPTPTLPLTTPYA